MDEDLRRQRELYRAISDNIPVAPVICDRRYLEQDVARELRAAGADAFLTRGGPADELVDAIRRAGRAAAPAEERA
jgi:DNA-binding NarL/FixJ family response regulator